MPLVEQKKMSLFENREIALKFLVSTMSFIIDNVKTRGANMDKAALVYQWLSYFRMYLNNLETFVYVSCWKWDYFKL